ncbi:Ppx/GppA phosphatase family protein [Undibacterium oligocarboniphilum]|uniref:Ppx/GppA family phosphatase n=1 Tax=Undibacterium oligocarboniphilum TaxID=666702 RepID=A0A850QHV6_9BURK|nr:Ppx/GppA phosphatase family protein [Undibacterium oligocarboniphilum]MBC3869055.1 Ppx/GppA family phosphatase [Undibacterium oligocarboniphilum]NVO77035.1 Ppx/GppA family phosphatase [Undibacterium oligocarboniphilum]
MLAAVDLGSNSFRMHIARHEGDAIRVVKSAREPIRLAAGLDLDGNLTPEAMQSAVSCLARFREILNAYPIDSLRVVATNTVRVAKNADQLLPRAEAAIGHAIDVISGEEEGRLIYMGVANAVAIPGERRLVMDIGGGSTEVILGRGHEIVKVESFSIGTVRHSASFFPDGRLTEAAFEAAVLSARSMFEDAAPPYQPQHWRKAYGSSGTMRAIADAIIKGGLGDGKLTLNSLNALKQYCVQCGQISDLELSGIRPERVAMVVGGLAILIGLMTEFQIEVLIPIEAGLRMGVMWDLHLRANKRDRREVAVQHVAQLFHTDMSRANRVADMVKSLYLQLRPAGDEYLRLLQWSATLHEVGMVVSHTGYHKHGAYMIENADMAGFTTREQRIMSKFILSQKGNLRKVAEGLSDPDFTKAVLALRLSVMLMHSRAEIEYEDMRLKMKKAIELEMRRDWVSGHPTVAYWLQKEIECWREIGVDFLVRTNV